MENGQLQILLVVLSIWILTRFSQCFKAQHSDRGKEVLRALELNYDAAIEGSKARHIKAKLIDKEQKRDDLRVMSSRYHAMLQKILKLKENSTYTLPKTIRGENKIRRSEFMYDVGML